MTEESPVRQQVRAMTAAGMTVRQIADARGTSEQAVRDLMAKMDLKPNPGRTEKTA